VPHRSRPSTRTGRRRSFTRRGVVVFLLAFGMLRTDTPEPGSQGARASQGTTSVAASGREVHRARKPSRAAAASGRRRRPVNRRSARPARVPERIEPRPPPEEALPALLAGGHRQPDPRPHPQPQGDESPAPPRQRLHRPHHQGRRGQGEHHQRPGQPPAPDHRMRVVLRFRGQGATLLEVRGLRESAWHVK